MTSTPLPLCAPNAITRYTTQPCWLGWVLIAATRRGVCAIAFDDTPAALIAQFQANFPQAQRGDGDDEFQIWVGQVLNWIETLDPSPHLPLDIQGTAFQRQVWQILQGIPLGTTLSYGEVAQRLGKPKAVRAVAQACARNSLAVVIPCHRVVGSDGSLRGYRWGGDRKQALLDRETAQRPSAISPH